MATTRKRTTKTESKTTTTRAKQAPPIDSLPTNPFAFEILELASKQRSKAKKIEVLKTYEDISLKSVFIWNFDETVVSLLPEGDVPYSDSDDQAMFKGTLSENLKKEADGGESATGQDLDARNKSSIRREYKHFYNFVQGGNDSLSKTRREMMYINILRTVHPKEAEILLLIKDKKLESKYKITKDIVSEAYPDIKWGGRS